MEMVIGCGESVFNVHEKVGQAEKATLLLPEIF